MREIKFRAWDKMRRKLVSVAMLSVGNNILGFDDGDAIEYGNIRDFELMQYTGLDDINGKSIYEGDIVEVNYSGNDDYKGNAQVVFKNGSFELVGKIMDMINQEAIMYDGFYSCTNELGRCSSNCAVIGNKYQNSELLEDK